MKKIFLVEDDLLTARAFQKLLEISGFEVTHALNGEEFLEKVHGGYDCVLLDIMLPVIDGWEVLKRVKERDDVRHIPVAFLTVLDDHKLRKKALSEGAAAFINKFQDDFLEKLNKILQK